jgi:hypothetical protein
LRIVLTLGGIRRHSVLRAGIQKRQRSFGCGEKFIHVLETLLAGGTKKQVLFQRTTFHVGKVSHGVSLKKVLGIRTMTSSTSVHTRTSTMIVSGSSNCSTRIAVQMDRRL